MGCPAAMEMTDSVKNTGVSSAGQYPYHANDAQDEHGSRATSIPLRTALRIAREKQRSKSSRRKIFREEPERYLDIVNLMRETGTE